MLFNPGNRRPGSRFSAPVTRSTSSGSRAGRGTGAEGGGRTSDRGGFSAKKRKGRKNRSRSVSQRPRSSDTEEAGDARRIGKVGRPLRGRQRIGREEAQRAQNKTESQVSSGLGSSPVKLDQAAEALGATHFSRKKAQEAQESDGGRTTDGGGRRAEGGERRTDG